MTTHALASHVAAVAGRSLSSVLQEATRLGLEELRYAQVTTGRRTTGALLAVAPGVKQLRITTSDPDLADLLVETLNACEEQANRKDASMQQPYSDKSNEPDLKAALDNYRAFALANGASEREAGEIHVIPLKYGNAYVQFNDTAPSAPSAAVQEAV
jgi:hypothetical protein